MLTSYCFSRLKHFWILDCKKYHVIMMRRKYRAFTVTSNANKYHLVRCSWIVSVSTFVKSPNFQSFIILASRTSEEVIPSVVIRSDIAQGQARHVKPFHLQYFFASLCLLGTCLVELMKIMQRSIILDLFQFINYVICSISAMPLLSYSLQPRNLHSTITISLPSPTTYIC